MDLTKQQNNTIMSLQKSACVHTHAICTFNNIVYINCTNAFCPQTHIQISHSCLHVNVCV